MSGTGQQLNAVRGLARETFATSAHPVYGGKAAQADLTGAIANLEVDATDPNNPTTVAGLNRLIIDAAAGPGSMLPTQQMA